MRIVPIHQATQPSLPLGQETATAVLGVGLLVFGLVAYDAYRRHGVS
ncbi:MAG: hypothetical protein ABEJ61_08510 [Haloferacaceae archaeon]